MKQGEQSSIGISKKLKERIQKKYLKLKQKDLINNYDDLLILLLDNYEKGGKNE